MILLLWVETFIIISLLVRRRSFDVRFVFCFSLLLYSLPLYFGCVSTPGFYSCQSIAFETYCIYAIAYSVSIAYLLLPERPGKPPLDELKKTHLDLVFLMLVLFFLAVFIANTGNPFAYANKRTFMDDLGFEWVLYKSLLIYYSVYVFCGLYETRSFHKAVVISLILFTTIIGARDVLVLSAIASFLMIMRGRRFSYFKMVALVVASSLAVIFVSVLKPLYAAVRSGHVTYNGLADFVSRGGEFLTRVSVANEVVRYDFQYSLELYLKSFFSILPFPSSVFGMSSGEFNKQMQQVLFSNMEGGIAYSPWAEAYSVGGYFGVFIFSLLFMSFLYFLEKWSGRKVVVAVVVAYCAFYIERNSLGTTLGYIRNIIYPVGFSFVVYYFFLKSGVIRRIDNND